MIQIIEIRDFNVPLKPDEYTYFRILENQVYLPADVQRKLPRDLDPHFPQADTAQPMTREHYRLEATGELTFIGWINLLRGGFDNVDAPVGLSPVQVTGEVRCSSMENCVANGHWRTADDYPIWKELHAPPPIDDVILEFNNGILQSARREAMPQWRDEDRFCW